MALLPGGLLAIPDHSRMVRILINKILQKTLRQTPPWSQKFLQETMVFHQYEIPGHHQKRHEHNQKITTPETLRISKWLISYVPHSKHMFSQLSPWKSPKLGIRNLCPPWLRSARASLKPASPIHFWGLPWRLGGTPIAGWFSMENTNPKWMMTRDTPISGNIYFNSDHRK